MKNAPAPSLVWSEDHLVFVLASLVRGCLVPMLTPLREICEKRAQGVEDDEEDNYETVLGWFNHCLGGVHTLLLAWFQPPVDLIPSVSRVLQGSVAEIVSDLVKGETRKPEVQELALRLFAIWTNNSGNPVVAAAIRPYHDPQSAIDTFTADVLDVEVLTGQLQPYDPESLSRQLEVGCRAVVRQFCAGLNSTNTSLPVWPIRPTADMVLLTPLDRFYQPTSSGLCARPELS